MGARSRARVLMEVYEGRTVGTILENGFLDYCTARGAEVLVVTPGARVPSFVDRHGRPGVSFVHLPLNLDLGRLASYELHLGRWLAMRGHVSLSRALWSLVGERAALAGAAREAELIRQFRPHVVLTTHVSDGFGRCLVTAARRAGIPTVGNLLSWDNAYRALKTRPDTIACWSDRNREELCSMCAYREEEVEVIGAPAFDPYFDPEGRWSRAELCARLGLDPRRQIVVFATLGQFRPYIDETAPFEALLRAIDRGEIPGAPQVILRLHPMSRDSYFDSFLERPDVKLSRFRHYVPGMMWAPTREEVVLAGNILRHADVCVSPGSTMTIEAAIFDTPTLVPVFNPYMPEDYQAYFRRSWLDCHFRALVAGDLLPIVRSAEEMAAAVARSLSDRSWYRQQRGAIRGRLLGPLDGGATARLAELVLRKAGLRLATTRGGERTA